MKSIAQIVVGLPLDGPFDYRVPQAFLGKIALGHRVSVPFGRRRMTGYVVGFVQESHLESLKEIDRLLEDEPLLSFEQLELSQWIAAHYGCSWGEAVETVLPFSVRKKKTLELSALWRRGPDPTGPHTQELFLMQDHEASLKEVARRIRKYTDQGKGVLLLAPDHAVSERMARYFGSVLDEPPVRLDGGPSKRQVQNWLAARHGEAHCVLGLRSAVFTPVRDLGLIVMFAEHQYGYQEDQTPFYHTRDVVRQRARIEGLDVIFLSIAPTVELWSEVEEKKITCQTFKSDHCAPMQLIDLTNYKPQRESYLSFPLADAAGKALDNGERVLILYNRRGFSTLTKCSGCGHVVACGRCNVPYVYAYEEKKMMCPSCGGKTDMIKRCPECHRELLHSYGEGIERVESNLARFFPQANLAAFDRETKRIPRRANLIIATQAVLKVLDGLDIDLAGVLDADAALSRFDFRCQQKVFSLLMDMRTGVRGNILVQTRDIKQTALACAAKGDFEGFYRHELDVRRETGFPPAMHLLVIAFRGKNETLVGEETDRVYEQFLEHRCDGLELLPPQPDLQPKLRDQYRFTIMGKCREVEPVIAYMKAVLKSVKKKRSVVITIHVDP